MVESLKMKYFKQTEAAIKSLESGGPIPDEILTSLRNDTRFQNLTVSKTGDKDFIEMQEVVLGSKSKQAQTYADKMEAEMWDTGRDAVDSITGEKELIKRLNIGQKGTGEKILEGTVVDEKTELFAFMGDLPKELQDKVALLPIDQQLPMLRKFKKAFDAYKAGDFEAGVDALQKQWLEDFPLKGKPHATGGLIDGYATGGVSNLFRQRYRSGKAVELVTKLPEFLKFVERLLIKASNQIRRGQGKWKDLTTAQKVAQHDNLTKLVTEFQKTKKFNPGMNEYFGIDAEKAFIEAQAKVKEKSIFSMTKEEKAARLKQYQAENPNIELSYGKKHSIPGPEGVDLAILKGNFERKYTGVIDDQLMKQVLADDNPQRISEIMATIDQSLAMQKKGMSSQSIMDTLLESWNRKKQAEGGLIPGYATGGVSNLFRSR